MLQKEPESQWDVAAYDEKAATALATALGEPIGFARVLVGRGICDAEHARTFLRPELSQLTDPFALPGVSAAVARTLQALERGALITVYGDYDCDGITASAILLEVLRSLGGKADSFIPRRVEDGFGFTLGALDKVLGDKRPDLIITADCGMRSREAVSEAKRAGVDVIVIDHHQPYGAPLPDEAVALIRPVDGEVPEAMATLSASGMAFTFCRALCIACEKRGIAGAAELDLWKYLDLVAIGTISDLLPLIGDNRILTYHGLRLLNDMTKRRPGILALVRAAGIRTEMGSYEVGFLLGPRLNAAGRVGSPDLALNLLLEQDVMQARRWAGQVDACNRERKRIEDGVLDAATDAVASALRANACALVAAGEGWHIGTIGVVAARLSGRHHRPAVVISYDKAGLGRGSCRSVSGVNLEDVLKHCSAYLDQYGGHPAAAGFVIQKKNIKAFAKAFEQACGKCLDRSAMLPHFFVDAWISLSEADDALLKSQEQLHPMGLGNQTPVFGVRNVRVQGPVRVMGANHLTLSLASGATQRDAIGYGLGDRKVPDGALDVLFQLQQNRFRGRTQLQLVVKDFRSSSGGS